MHAYDKCFRGFLIYRRLYEERAEVSGEQYDH